MKNGLEDLKIDDMSIGKEEKPTLKIEKGTNKPKAYQVQLDFTKWAKIGGDFYLLTSVGWIPRRGTEFDDIFGKVERKRVPSYFKFFVKPGHHSKYESKRTTKDGIEINFYRPLSYTPKKGSWKAIDKIITHLGHSESYGHQFILDWMWLKHVHSERSVPFLLFVGGKGGGKSTWEHLCGGLWEDNFFAGYVGDVMKSDNIHLFGKNAIHIREKELNEKYSDTEAQKFKSMVTQTTAQFRALFHDTVTGPCYVGYSLDSNNIETTTKIEKENRRFATFDVPKLTEDQRYRGIFDEIKDEIPAFAYYLENEHVYDSKLGREKNDLWFYEKYINTEASKRIQRNSESDEIKLEDEFDSHLSNLINEVKCDVDIKLVINITEFSNLMKNKGASSGTRDDKRAMHKVLLRRSGAPSSNSVNPGSNVRRLYRESIIISDTVRISGYVVRIDSK